GRLQLQVRAERAAVGAQVIDSIAVDLDGNTADHTLAAAAKAAERQLRLSVQGAYSGKGAGSEDLFWQGTLRDLTLTGPEGDLALAEPAAIRVGETRLQVDPFCLDHKGQRM